MNDPRTGPTAEPPAPTSVDAEARRAYPNSPELWGGPTRAGGYESKRESPAPLSPAERTPSPSPSPSPSPGAGARPGGLTLPEGIDANAPELATFRQVASELGDGAAQKVLDWHFSARATVAAAQQERWVAATRADPEIGGEHLQGALADSKQLIDEFGNEALRGVITAAPVGDHPEVIRFLTKVARALRSARGRG